MKNTIDKYARWGFLALALGLGWFVFGHALGYTVHMFGDPVEDMSHGWLVPVVSATMVWAQRARIRQAAGRPSWMGVCAVFFFLVIAWFGRRGLQERLEQVSMIGLVWAVPYAFWGKKVARLMRFPAVYLLFIVPCGSYLDFFTIHLRILSSSLSTAILNGFGLMVEQSGTALFSRTPGAEFSVDVAQPCSGIRSLFAMMALTAAYAHFVLRTSAQKWILFVCSIPLAVVGNIVRIMSICWVASLFGQKVATGFYHDYSGYVVFLVGVALMVETGVLLKKIERFLRPVVSGDEGGGEYSLSCSRGAGPLAGWWDWLAVSAPLVMLVGVLVLRANIKPPQYSGVDFVASSLPDRMEGFTSDVPWFCRNEQCLRTRGEGELKKAGVIWAGEPVCPDCGQRMYRTSLGESKLLPSDTAMSKRSYVTPDGLTYSVSMVVAGKRRGSIHRPELCLPAQGFVMTDARRIPVHVDGGIPSRVRMISVQTADGRRFSLVYWFFCEGRESCSHSERIMSDIWDRTVHNKINRWVMVAVTVSADLKADGDMRAFESFLSDLASKIVRKPRGCNDR